MIRDMLLCAIFLLVAYMVYVVTNPREVACELPDLAINTEFEV